MSSDAQNSDKLDENDVKANIIPNNNADETMIVDNNNSGLEGNSQEDAQGSKELNENSEINNTLSVNGWETPPQVFLKISTKVDFYNL